MQSLQRRMSSADLYRKSDEATPNRIMGYTGTLWGVHAKATMLRSGRVEERKSKRRHTQHDFHIYIVAYVNILLGVSTLNLFLISKWS